MADDSRETANTLQRLSRRMLLISSNRAELFALELQEERTRIFNTGLLILAFSALGLLAGIALSGAIVLALWSTSPMSVLITLGILYALGAALLHRTLVWRLANWRPFSGSFQELRKDANAAGEFFT